jgi:hypothetical protein
MDSVKIVATVHWKLLAYSPSITGHSWNIYYHHGFITSSPECVCIKISPYNVLMYDLHILRHLTELRILGGLDKS